MVKDVAYYGLGRGINVGTAFLLLPLLTDTLTLREFGLYNLAQIGVRLFVPFASLNGAAAILREGADDLARGIWLLRFYNLLVLSVTGCAWLVLTFAATHLEGWVLYVVLIGGTEALANQILALFRCAEKSGHYLAYVAAKSMGLFAVVVWAHEYGAGLGFILEAQWVVFFVVFLAAAGIVEIRWRVSNVGKAMAPTDGVRPVLMFSVLLIPHSVAQWIMSGSDRYIIKILEGDAAVGAYSIAYTLGMVLMLLNSGLALALPQDMIKDYAKWCSRSSVLRLMFAYAALATLLAILVLAVLQLDKDSLGYLHYYDSELPTMVAVVAVALAMLGFYYFFGNYTFYFRRTGQIAMLTSGGAVLNVLLTILFVRWLGIIGAAWATLISYAVYALGAMILAIRLEPALRQTVKPVLMLMLGTSVVILTAGFLQSMWWHRAG